MIFYVKSMIQYNPNASIIMIEQPDKDKIKLELKEQSPLLIKNAHDIVISLDSMNYQIPGYIINDKETLLSLDQLCKSDSITIYNNYKLLEDFKLNQVAISIEELITSFIKCDSVYGLSLYKGEQTSSLLKNYRETTFIQPLLGTITIYLFNPKHEKEIKGLELQSIKKWGIKLELTKDVLLYIPPEWFYFYEIKQETILLHGQSDTYFSWMFNYLRKK